MIRIPESSEGRTDQVPWVAFEEGANEHTRAFLNDPIQFSLDAYQKHGDTFALRLFGRDFIGLAGVESNRFVWGNDKLWDFPLTKRIFVEQFDETYLPTLESTPHRKKRRRISSGFRPKTLMGQTGAMTKVMLEELEKLPDGKTDLRLFSARLLICMTARVLMQTDIPPGLDEVMVRFNKEMLSAESLGEKRFEMYQEEGYKSRKRAIFDYINDFLDHYEREDNSVRDDILSVVLRAHPETEEPIGRRELVQDIQQLFTAGATTTSQMIIWTLVYLDHYPDWKQKLLEELDTNWNREQFTGMERLPKLKATLLEIERLRGPSPMVTRTSGEALSFQGHRFPKGTNFMHFQMIPHYLEEHYEDPMSFRPSRFLNDPSLPKRWIHGTYGGGGHVCVGQPLARMTPPLAIGNLLSRYEVHFETTVDLQASFDTVTTPHPKVIPVVFDARP
ncbi:MAG: cytochrome P450 [Verrucomicrobiota bacterium]